MTAPPGASLTRLAFVVGDALRRAGIDAALTGGACATFHSAGAYTSLDIDFVIRSSPSNAEVDRAMASVGFTREGARYVHNASTFFVEFVPGPLAVGNDAEVRPVRVTRGKATILALSPTDSCRDRLAAFYHWRDRPSLHAAVEIAARHRVSLARIKAWSLQEDARAGFEEFTERLRARRRRKTR